MLCPKCGTANPDNSEFCINCGQDLVDNADDTVVLQSQPNRPKWGDEIVPTWLLNLQNDLPEDLRDPGLDDMIRQKSFVAIQRIEPSPIIEEKKAELVPQEELTPEIEAESEEWLNEVLASMKKDSSVPEQEPPAQKSPGEAVEADDWLRSLMDLPEEDEFTPAIEEDVIGFEDEAESPLGGSAFGGGTDWLNQFRVPIEEDTIPQEIHSEPTTDEIPDWLRASFVENAVTEEALDLSPQADAGSSNMEPTLSEWLRALEKPSEEVEEIASGKPALERKPKPPAASEEQAMEIPDWLKASGEPSTQATELIPPVLGAVPDWLSSYQEKSDALPEEPTAAESQAMPDWLAAYVVETPPSLAESVTLPFESVEPSSQDREVTDTGFVEEESPQVEADFRSWLEEPELRPEAAEDVTLTEGLLPSWLLDIDLEEVSEPEPVTDETVKMETTAISQEEIAPEPEEVRQEEEKISVSEEPPLDVETGLAGADVPDWLLSIKDQEMLFADEGLEPEDLDEEGIEIELPDWLRTEEFAPVDEESLEPESLDAEGVEVELPDWLQTMESEPVVEAGLPESAQPEATEEAISEEEFDTAAESITSEPESPEPMADEEDSWLARLSKADLESPTEVIPVAGLAAATEFDEFEGRGELPDWIREIEDQSEEDSIMPEDEIADEDFSGGAEVEMEGAIPLSRVTPGEISADRSEMPEWLRELRDQEPFDETEPPVWLTEPGAEIRDELTGEELPDLAEETPTWLAGIPLDDKEGQADDVPDWLRDLDESEKEFSEESPTSEGEIPSWLKQMSEPETLDSSSALEKAELEEIQPLPSEQPTISAPSLKLPTQESLPESELTEAMDSIKSHKMGVAPEEKGRLRDLPLKKSAILAGISSVLNAETAISTSKPGHDLVPKPIPEGTTQAQVFEEIVSQPLVPKSSALAHKRSRLWGKVGHLFLYLLIIAAVVITLYWQGALEIGFVSEYNIPISAQTQNVYNQIDAVTEQSTVLLILDYEPSLAEELNLQARALLQSFMQHRFKILLVSTTFTGPQIAQNMMDDLASQSKFNYKYGEDYINLGYLPGRETSLMMFGQSPLAAVQVDFRDKQSLENYPISQKLQNVPVDGWGQVTPLIVNLSSNQETLRIWIEQILAANEDAQMIAGVSAGLVPYVQPYLESGQLLGVLGGLTSAAEYESLAQRPGRAIRGIDSQLAVHLIIVAVIVLGNFAYLTRRAVRRRR